MEFSLANEVKFNIAEYHVNVEKATVHQVPNALSVPASAASQSTSLMVNFPL